MTFWVWLLSFSAVFSRLYVGLQAFLWPKIFTVCADHFWGDLGHPQLALDPRLPQLHLVASFLATCRSVPCVTAMPLCQPLFLLPLGWPPVPDPSITSSSNTHLAVSALPCSVLLLSALLSPPAPCTPFTPHPSFLLCHWDQPSGPR